MEGERKFFPTWRLSVRLGTTYGVALAGFTLLTQEIVPHLTGQGPQIEFSVALVRTAEIAPFGVLAFTGLFYALGRLCPVKVTAAGVVGSTYWGRARFVKWSDVQRVAPYNLGIRMLRLDCASPEYIFVPMRLDDRSDLRAFVSQYAGPDHPLTKWLG